MKVMSISEFHDNSTTPLAILNLDPTSDVLLTSLPKLRRHFIISCTITDGVVSTRDLLLSADAVTFDDPRTHLRRALRILYNLLRMGYGLGPYSGGGGGGGRVKIICRCLDVANDRIPKNETVLSYDDIDMNLVRFRVPYVRSETIDVLSGVVADATQLLDRRRLLSLLVMDFGVKGCRGGAGSIYEYDVDAIQLNNWLGAFFRLCPETVAVQRAYNERMAMRLQSTQGPLAVIGKLRNGSSSILLEPFSSDETLSIAPEGNVTGGFKHMFDGEVKALVLDDAMIEGVPVQRGDRVILAHQTRVIENDEYLAMSPRVLVSSVVTYDLPEKFSAMTNVDYKATFRSVSFAAGTRVYLAQLKTKFLVTEASHPQYVLRALPPAVPRSIDGQRAYCLGAPEIKSRELCVLGAGKVWDAPCVHDTQCPFYQNARESGYEGGCENGYCQMPLGTQLVGHTYFQGTPLRPLLFLPREKN